MVGASDGEETKDPRVSCRRAWAAVKATRVFLAWVSSPVFSVERMVKDAASASRETTTSTAAISTRVNPLKIRVLNTPETVLGGVGVAWRRAGPSWTRSGRGAR